MSSCGSRRTVRTALVNAPVVVVRSRMFALCNFVPEQMPRLYDVLAANLLILFHVNVFFAYSFFGTRRIPGIYAITKRCCVRCQTQHSQVRQDWTVSTRFVDLAIGMSKNFYVKYMKPNHYCDSYNGMSAILAQASCVPMYAPSGWHFVT